MEVIDSNQDRKHWGSYQAVGHNFEALAQDPILTTQRLVDQKPATLPMMSLPGFDLRQLGFGVQTVGNLQMIELSFKTPLIQALTLTTFFEHTTLPTGAVIGGAQPRFGMPTTNWVHEKVAQGYAVLVNVPSATSSAAGEFMVTADPHVIAVQAKPGAEWAVLDAPPTLVDEAQAAGPPAPTGLPARPQVEPPELLELPPTPAAAPSWVGPAVLAFGVLALGALVFGTADRKGKKKRARAA